MDDYPASEPIPDPNNFNDVMDFLKNSKEMRETARSSLKQAAYAGGGALAGGFLLGPLGGMIGGVIGSIVGFIKADDYDGALMTLNKLNDDEKRVLMKRFGQVLMAAGATASQLNSPTMFMDTLVSLASQKSVRDELWNVCVESLQN